MRLPIPLLSLLLVPAVSPSRGGAEVAGVVKTREGAAVPRAEIRLQRPDGPTPSGPPAAVADEAGAFAVTVPSAGAWFVWASAAGFVDTRGGPVEAKDGTRVDGLEIRPFAVGTGSASGTVTDREGKPIEGVVVEASATSRAFGAPIVRTTGADGRWAFEALNAGTTNVVFRLAAPGADPDAVVESRATHALKEGEAWVLDLVLARPTLRFEGRLTDAAGAPVAGARVVARFEPTFTERYAFGSATATTGADGSFRVDGVIAGEYRLQFFGRADGAERFLGERAGVNAAGGRVDYALPAERPVLVEGICVNVDQDRPVPGSEVKLTIGADTIATDKSDIEGRFSFGAVLSKDLPNILRVTHRMVGYEERWLYPNEVRPDGRYPELTFAVTKRRAEDAPR